MTLTQWVLLVVLVLLGIGTYFGILLLLARLLGTNDHAPGLLCPDCLHVLDCHEPLSIEADDARLWHCQECGKVCTPC